MDTNCMDVWKVVSFLSTLIVVQQLIIIILVRRKRGRKPQDVESGEIILEETGQAAESVLMGESSQGNVIAFSAQGQAAESVLKEGESSQGDGDVMTAPPAVKKTKHIIKLRKGEKPLAFTIVGGVDSPKGPMGIYVKTIFKQGQAEECGMKEGDQILSINGKSVENLKHDESLALIRKIKPPHREVVIEVIRRQKRHETNIVRLPRADSEPASLHRKYIGMHGIMEQSSDETKPGSGLKRQTPLQPRPVTPFEVVRVKSFRVEKEVAVQVMIKTKSDVNSNYIPKKSRIPQTVAAKISYAEPEPRHIISRASSEDSVDKNKISRELDLFIMVGKPPPRAIDTHQNVQLVKPKAIIPINSERPLPNPYQDKPPLPPNVKTIERNLNMGSGKDAPMKQYGDFRDGVYGTVYDRRLLRPKPSSPEQFSPKTHSSGTSSPISNPRMSPRSPPLKGSKLRLPVHREKVDLQPRIKSPTPSIMVSSDKIIANELLKKRKDKKRTSPCHPRLEIEIEYPGPDLPKLPAMPPIGKPPISPKAAPNLETGEWHKRQRDLNSPSSIPLQVTTNVMVHVDSQSPQNKSMASSQELHSRSIKPVTIRSQSFTLSLQHTPPKHEIRQMVEAICWTELKKMKEKEDGELQMKLQLTPYGYAEDSVISHRSRSMSPNLARNTRRNASLPREIERQRWLEATNAERHRQPPNLQNQSYCQLQGTAMYNPIFTWKSPQRNTVNGPRNGYDTSQRPIFKRGSLTQQTSYDTQIYNKKVSFYSPQKAQNSQK